MTKEQEETIEIVKKYLNFNEICGTRNFKDALDTVLSMLKEKDKEIKKKDKIIDLMAEHINYLSDELVQATGRNELEFCNGNKYCIDSDYSCEQCIKQYFERKSKE